MNTMNTYLAGLLLVSTIGVANANIIRNSSFEDVPNASTGQALMPSEWLTAYSSPDTYSNDGSYGLSPSGYNNFTGVTAYDGIRWVAGWSSADERFGQVISENLVAGTEYTMSGFLHQAVRSDLNNPGGYEIYLTSSSSDAPLSGESLGFLGSTNGTAEGWQEYSFSFIATAEMSSLSFLMFDPFGGGASTYPGLDSVSLNVSSVPVPAAVWLFATGLLGLVGVARRKKA